MSRVHVQGGRKHQREYLERTVRWCINRMGLKSLRRLEVVVKIKPLADCSGWCRPANESMRCFEIAVDPSQSLRNLVATAVHEMIHVKQYARHEWLIDGEPEAWGSQWILADELWKDDAL
jgi:hypothetical protein